MPTATMELESNQEILPSGMYKTMLVDRLLKRFVRHDPVLEVGCATGEFLAKLARRGRHGIGIDPCRESIQVAQRRLAGTGFDVHHVGLFEFDRTGFGSVFIFEVLEHIPEDQEAMRRLASFLEPNGHLMLSVPAKQSLFSEEDHFQGHVRRYERAELCGKLQEAGFDVRKFWCYNPLPYVRKILMGEQAGPQKGEKSLERRTEESAYDMHPFTRKWVRRLYPIYSRVKFLLRVQDLFLRTDLGAHYLVVASKR